jgi:hypothetical protein
MKLSILVFSAILFISMSFSQENIFDDPIKSLCGSEDTTDLEMYSGRLLVKINLDFNNDGIVDLAFSDTEAWGNAGGDWTIYLGRKDGKFESIGEVFFHPLAFKIQPIKYGISKMIIYRRAGGGEGDLIEYSISINGIKEIKSRLMKPDDKSEKDYDIYWKLFGDLYNNPKSTCCIMVDYIKNNNCKWYPGYTIENK